MPRILVIWLCLGLLALAGPRDGKTVALVVDVKGVALVKVPGDPPSRAGTQLKLLTPLQEGRTVVVQPGGQLVLSFATSARRVSLTGPVEVVLNATSVALKSGQQSSIRETAIKGRQAVLAPKETVDFSRMGGVSARATGNVRTDVARPSLGLDVVRGQGSPFTVAPGEVKTVRYLKLDPSMSAASTWATGNVTGQAGDRVTLDFDLQPDSAYFLQLADQPPAWNAGAKAFDRTDYWIYRYPTSTADELQVAAEIAGEPGEDLPVRQMQLSDVYRSYHLFEKAIAVVSKLPATPQTSELIQQLQSERLESERSTGG